MQYKSALQFLLDQSNAKKPGSWFPKSDPKVAIEKYIEEIDGYEKSVRIVVGEGGRRLYDKTEFGVAVKEGLTNHPESTFTFVFHKDDDIERAKERFQREHRVIMSLKREFHNRVHIYWSPIRPEQHYAVIDMRKVIVEEPHHISGDRWAYAVSEPTKAKSWQERFDKYIEYCEELSFEFPS